MEARQMSELPFLNAIDPKDIGAGAQLAARLGEYRAQTWGALSPRGLEVFRYKEAISVLRSKNFETDASDLYEGAGLTGADALQCDIAGLLGMNGPLHLRLRSLFVDYLSPRRVEKWRSSIAEIVESRLLNAMTLDSFDLAHRVCFPLPAVLFCRIIGAPDSDGAFLWRMSDGLLKVFLRDPAYKDEILTLARELDDYVEALIAARRANPDDDLISYFLSRQKDFDLSDAEICGHVRSFLAASADNTGNQFAMTMIDLLSVSKRWSSIVGNPDLIPLAVDESIRLHPRVGLILRRCVVDTEINGINIPAGTIVNVSAIAAQRDPEGLDAPELYRIDRPQNRPLLTFGGGAHHCVGSSLAKLEINVGIGVIAEKAPGLHLSGEPDWLMLDRLNCVNFLPVRCVA